QLSTDFNTRFVPQTESYVEQAFWSQYSVQTNKPTHSGTTIVEVPKELPKVSMVNSCVKKLKYHLASFDIVVKERTTATAITEGTWGFEHTKACFRDDIIPFVKNLKDLFTLFDQYLINEVSEVQKTFKQMEMAVEQNCAAKTEFQTKMESVLKENDRLLKHALGVDIVNIVSQFQPQVTSYQSSPYGPTYHNSQFISSGPSSLTHSISYPGTDASSLVNHNAYMASSSAPQIAYAQMDQQSPEYSPPEAGLVVLNFVSAGSSRPFTSGQGRVQGKQRVIMCYNCKGKGHMSKQCT
nr:hypothetical protein [Tanacetum cinerariifolium]